LARLADVTFEPTASASLTELVAPRVFALNSLELLFLTGTRLAVLVLVSFPAHAKWVRAAKNERTTNAIAMVETTRAVL
jgi:hypothetical protein